MQNPGIQIAKKIKTKRIIDIKQSERINSVGKDQPYYIVAMYQVWSQLLKYFEIANDFCKMLELTHFVCWVQGSFNKYANQKSAQNGHRNMCIGTRDREFDRKAKVKKILWQRVLTWNESLNSAS